jgi:8-oxo-dGTP pyrophosphatase MutT (NUDIX family)
MELGETTAEGAVREVWEEATARVRVEDLIGIYEIPRISQVQFFYRAPMTGSGFAAGEESLAVDLFDWDDIPWDQLAFPSVTWVLQRYRAGGGPWFATVPHGP